MNFFSTKKSVLESALYYASSGYKVFPCFYYKNEDNSKGKFSPFCKHGYKAATSDIKKIVEWWLAHPEALIGIATGQESGILAVTVDKNSNFTAKTPCFISNFDEKTYIFKNPGKKFSSGKIENFSFYGEAGFIVVPPAASDYVLEIVADGELSEVPAEILNKMNEIAAVEAAMNELLPVEAQRQQEQQAQEGTAPVDQEGQEEDDQEEESGLPELPLHCLPPRLQKLIVGTAASLDVDPWLSFAAAMQTVSTLVGANYLLDGLIPAPAHLWVAIVGPSGFGKSALCDLFSTPVHTLQRQNDKFFATAMEEHDEDFLTYEEDLKKWVKGGKEGEKPTKPTKPICKTYYVDDITSEKLQLTLAENPAGVCWSPDELTKFLGSFGRYSKGGSKTAVDPAKSAILSAYNGGSCRTSRMGREQVTTDRMWLSIYGTIQPEILGTSFQTEDQFSGFLHRFLFIILPVKNPEHEKSRKKPGDFVDEVNDYFAPLLTGHEVVLKKYASEEEILDKKTEPKRIQIEEKGIEIIQDFNFSLAQSAYNSIKLGDKSCVGNQQTMARRLQGQLPRLILILHAIECAERGIEISGIVSTQTVKRAIEIFDAIIKHIYHAWGLITGKQKIITAKKEEFLEILATIDPYINKAGDFYELSYTDMYKGQKLADILCKKLFAEGGTKQKLTKALEKLGFSNWRRESGKVMRIEKTDYETKFLKAVGTKKITIPQDAGAEVSNIF